MQNECPNLSLCPMFAIFRMEASKKYYIAMFCHRDFEKCQRKIRKQKDGAVPDNLLPDGGVLQR